MTFISTLSKFLNLMTFLGSAYFCELSKFRPVSATFLMVCLKAQMMESRISLNWAGAMDRKAGKHWEVAA